MNLSNPKTQVINKKKQSNIASVSEKITNIILFISSMGSMLLPTQDKNIDPAKKEKVIRYIMYSVIIFTLIGLVSTFYFLVKLIIYFF